MPVRLIRNSVRDVVEVASERRRDDRLPLPERVQAFAESQRVAPVSGRPAANPDEPAGYLLEEWLAHHSELTPEQHSAFLSSAFALLDEARRALAEARHQLEFERRNTSSARETLESRLGEALAEQQSLREQLEETQPAEDALEQAVQAAIERERHTAVEGELVAERERHAAVEGELVAERERHAAVEGELVAERERHAAVEGELVAERERHAAVEGELVADRERLEHRIAEAAVLVAELESERGGWVQASERAIAAERGAVEERDRLASQHAKALSQLADLERERAQWAQVCERHVLEAREASSAQSEVEERFAEAVARIESLEGERARWLEDVERREAQRRQAEEAARELEYSHAESRARLFEVECEFALERERWVDERVRFEDEASRIGDVRECLERDHARVCAERERLIVAKRSLESWLESMLARHALPDVVQRPGGASALGSPSDACTLETVDGAPDPMAELDVETSTAPEWSSMPEEHAGEAPAGGHACADEVEDLTYDAALRIARSERRARVGTVHAVLLVDDVEHLHGCLAAEEIPGLIAELHRVEWLVGQRVAMGEQGDHPVLGEIGMPVSEFLFGVLPDFLLDISDASLDIVDLQCDLSAIEAAEAQFEKLVKLHGVLNEFVGRALTDRVVVLPRHLAFPGGAESFVDPLSALDALYEEVDASYTGTDEDGALVLEVIDRVVSRSVWRDVDGQPLDAMTQRKLLYLLLRLVNSAQAVLFESFVRVQEQRRFEA